MHFQEEISFQWLLSRDVTQVKALARVMLASDLWNVKNDLAIELIRAKKEDSWNNSIRDTSRAVSALANIGIIFTGVEKWMLAKQDDGSWNNNIYDTVYALIALADMGKYNAKGCNWLVKNYSSEWEYPGTTALIISTLIAQNNVSGSEDADYDNFIGERARWILTQRDRKGAWKTIATSNICMQALISAGYSHELNDEIDWLLGKMNHNGSWGKDGGNVTATALSLITLARFTGKV